MYPGLPIALQAHRRTASHRATILQTMSQAEFSAADGSDLIVGCLN